MTGETQPGKNSRKNKASTEKAQGVQSRGDCAKRAGSDSVGEGWGLRVHISKELTVETRDAGVMNTYGGIKM